MKNNYGLKKPTDIDNLHKIIIPVIYKVFNCKIVFIKRFDTGLCHFVYDVILDNKENIVFRISTQENKNQLEGSVYWYKYST